METVATDRITRRKRYRKKQNRLAELGREFHGGLLFEKCAKDHELLQEGEALSTPCYTMIKRPAKRHYLSDARFEAVEGFCVQKTVFWRYNLPTGLTAELERKANLQETCTIAINLLEVLGMIVTAWVMLELVGDRPDVTGVSKRWGHRQKGLLTH